MPPTRLCIVARPMRRLALAIVLGGVMTSTACEQLEGRNANRAGNRNFRDMKFIDAAAEYEHALKTVDHPIVHYNLALTYKKIAAGDDIVRIGEDGDFACTKIPGVKTAPARVCVKPGARDYDDCDDKKVCASSYTCKQTTLCTVESKAVAKLATEHFQKWLDANPKDEETRKQMTQVWLDAGQYELALAYWKEQLAARGGKDAEVMSILGGITLKAQDWRGAIDWYEKAAETATEPTAKISSLQFIGNVAWSKLNSKSLGPIESMEVADLGIGALQRAAELDPKNPRLFFLQASLLGFRAAIHGASWASAIDRASQEDLRGVGRVIRDEAKKQQEAEEAAVKAAPDPSKPAAPTPPKGPAEKAGG